MYWPDKVRSFINRYLRIDKDFLIREQVLNYIIPYEYRDNAYNFRIFGKSIELRNLSSDLIVYKQVFLDEEYSFAIELYHEYFDANPKLILDIGANIGLTSLYFYSKFNNPDLVIIAVEPELQNFIQLKKNTSAYNSIKVLNNAIWNKAGKLSISNQFRDGRSWSYQVVESEGFQFVQSITLKEILQHTKVQVIDIFKMDVEGAEKQIILEYDELGQILRNTRIICVEIHDSVVSRIDITKKLVDFGFHIYAKNETLYGVNKNTF